MRNGWEEGVPDSENGVWKKKKTYNLFWKGWTIKCDGEEAGNGIDYAAGVLGWTRPYAKLWSLNLIL